MSGPVLTAVDLTGIQPFVFASNRLRDVLGGSWLVGWATDATEKGAIGTADPAGGEVLIASGGNAIIRFADAAAARGFAARYTRLLFEQARGLEAVVVHQACPDGGLADALIALGSRVARTKTERLPHAHLLGLGVTAQCRETMLPATGMAKEDVSAPLSAGVLSRRRAVRDGAALRRWDPFLVDCDGLAATFPVELDDLGRTRGESSQIGIVHIDANGLGERIVQWLDDCVEHEVPDPEVISALRGWSGALDDLVAAAMGAIVRRVTTAVRQGASGPELAHLGPGEPIALRTDHEGAVLLPVRPILMGGDDLTIVCDGRIALDLAVAGLRVFGRAVPGLEGSIGACAGVAIVRSHAPFARAYELSESLCRSAKEHLRNEGEKAGREGRAIDWHVGAARPGETPEAIRSRQYAIGAETALTARPYRLESSSGQELSWDWLAGCLLGTGDRGLRGPMWSERRSKVNALRDLSRRGDAWVRRSLHAWRTLEPALALPAPIESNGFHGERTPLLDAIELMDLHLPLPEPTADPGGGQ